MKLPRKRIHDPRPYMNLAFDDPEEAGVNLAEQKKRAKMRKVKRHAKTAGIILLTGLAVLTPWLVEGLISKKRKKRRESLGHFDG